ncbi:hypothetical protein DPMN_016632 [Dreissena polymorpha]|uniref:Uncharacterized protein n=1 Tax=Dreissena polymorpha TaxID=45954 RepID=A0A9D4S4R5_DREPO|nr:hypothetical protein DPMN_016632 [Dreissena polymorpha]
MIVRSRSLIDLTSNPEPIRRSDIGLNFCDNAGTKLYLSTVPLNQSATWRRDLGRMVHLRWPYSLGQACTL